MLSKLVSQTKAFLFTLHSMGYFITATRRDAKTPWKHEDLGLDQCKKLNMVGYTYDPITGEAERKIWMGLVPWFV